MAMFGVIKDLPDLSDPGVRAEDQTKYEAKIQSEGTVPYDFGDGNIKNIPPSTAAQLEANKKIAADVRSKLANNGVPPTKINITTGEGVPGGFDAASVKTPASVVADTSSTLSSIGDMAGKITAGIAAVVSGALAAIPGLMGASKILSTLKSKATSKLNAAIKAPDFSKKYKLPAPPKLPSVPDFKSLGIPAIPSIPKVPSVPTLPSIPSIPKMPSIKGL